MAGVRFEEAQALKSQVDEMRKEMKESQKQATRDHTRTIQAIEGIIEANKRGNQRVIELEAAYKSQLEAITSFYKDRTLEAETRMEIKMETWKAEQQGEMQKQMEAMASFYKDRAIEADARTDIWITKMETLIDKVEAKATHPTTKKVAVTAGDASIWGRGLFQGSLFRANKPTQYTNSPDPLD